MSISRLYDFTPNTTILSSQVDDEFNQLISEVNLMLKKDGSEAMTGDLQIQKSNPAVLLLGTEVSAKSWRIREDAGLLNIQVDNAGYENGVSFERISATLKALYPTTDIQAQLGKSGKNFQSLSLDNAATDGGAVFFNNQGSFLKSSPDGLQLNVGTFTSLIPSVADACSLGTTSFYWSKLFLKTLGSAATPEANSNYADMIPKAWASVSSTRTLNSGVNLTVAAGTSGVAEFTFRRAMANTNYAVVVVQDNGTGSSTGTAVMSVRSKTTSGFEAVTVSTSTGSVVPWVLGGSVMVMGTQ